LETKSSLRGLWFLAPVVLLWASTPLLVSELSLELPIWEASALITAFSSLTLAAAVTALGRWGALRALRGRQIASLLGLGAGAMFPYTALYYLAFALAPAAAGEANIINYLWPLWVLLLSVPLLGETLSWNKALGMLIAFAGVYLLISGGSRIRFSAENLPAYACAGAGAFFWGLFSVLSKRQGDREPLTALWLYLTASFLGFALLALALAATGAIRLAAPSGRAWWMLAVVGAGANGLAALFWVLALRYGDTALVSTLAYLTPFLALVYLAVFRGTPIRPLEIASLALILGGPLLERFGRRAGRRPTRRPSGSWPPPR
jgi:drug/metabolite transporter (DMT)-like permease